MNYVRGAQPLKRVIPLSGLSGGFSVFAFDPGILGTWSVARWHPLIDGSEQFHVAVSFPRKQYRIGGDEEMEMDFQFGWTSVRV